MAGMFKDLWNKLMGYSQKNINIPEFPEDEEKRYQIIFSGIVQGVGFRYEIWMFAEKLGLTGYAENLPNGDVHVEVQGAENKIMYLIECMKSISRIQIDKVEMEEIALKEEKEFTPIY